jgi:integrase
VDDEIEEVLTHASDASRPLIRAAALTGLDRCDLIALNWSNIGEDGFIRTRRQKTAELAVVPVHDALADVLKAVPRASPKVFVNGKGEPWRGDGFSTGFRRAKIKASARFPNLGEKRFKDLRGTAATYFYRRGLKDAEVAEILGWTAETCKEIRKEYVTDAARAAGLVEQLNKARTKM